MEILLTARAVVGCIAMMGAAIFAMPWVAHILGVAGRPKA